MKTGQMCSVCVLSRLKSRSKNRLSALIFGGTSPTLILKSIGASPAIARSGSWLLAMDSESSSGDDIVLDGDSGQSLDFSADA